MAKNPFPPNVKNFFVLGKNGAGKVDVLQVYRSEKIKRVYNVLPNVNTFYLKMPVFNKLVEGFHVYYWPVASLSFRDYKKSANKT